MATKAGGPRGWLDRWHPEGIPWPFALLYNAVSRTGVFQQHYGLVADEVAQAIRGDRILDVGTGPGWLLTALHQRLPSAHLVGVDISPAMVVVATRNLAAAGGAGWAEVVCAGAGALPFPDASFDLVVSTGSLHHWSDRAAGLDEAWRVLKPGGRALVYDLVRHVPPEVSRELRRRFGGFRVALMWLHSFEEPFLDPEEMRLLAQQTRFGGGGGETHFTGGLCCLEMRRRP